ncbi:hypothetical protein NLG97_g4832 [Lecanicillium saksenae]|uniref:Uncharacterized protein n=1 Tax=Lecanicillium saksenae TaxID=468837 RepID=A0ACC1QVD7_9HYPO|nr:hypothetical protein NLG97_g4832 [Lecanicillium saksenae]
MARASWHGSRIIMRQVSSESTDIFDFIMHLYQACGGSWNEFVTKYAVAPKDLQSFLEYAATFLCNLGNYYGEGDKKFVPNLTADVLRTMASISQKATENLDKIIDAMLAVPPFGLGYPSNNAASSYYLGTEPISRAEIAHVSEIMANRRLEPENTRLQKVKAGDKSVYHVLQASIEKDEVPLSLGSDVFVVRGDHAKELESIVKSLTEASKYAGNPLLTSFDNFLRQLPSTTSFDNFLRQLPWAVDGVNDGKGPFEKTLFEAPDFTSIHALAVCGSVVFEAANLPNYNDIRETIGFKNIVLANRLSVNDNPNLPCPWVDASEFRRFKSTTHIVRFRCTAIHELLGHGSGKLLSETEMGVYNFDNKNPPVDPLTKELVRSHYLVGENWGSVFGELAGTVEECRAILISMYLMDNKKLLEIFDYTDVSEITADELLYATYMSIGVYGLEALQHYSIENQAWGQVHHQAYFSILKHVLQDGNGVVRIDHNRSTGELTVRVDPSKFHSHGKPALGSYLCRLHIWRCTADVSSCRDLYESLCVVDGEYENWRKIVCSKPNPRWKFVQPNTFINGESVEMKVYEESNEGIIQSLQLVAPRDLCEIPVGAPANVLLCWEPLPTPAATGMATNADGAFWAPIASIFDFTLKFEETIFGIAVSAVVLLLAPFIFWHYFKKPVYARGGILLGIKLSMAGILFAAQLAILVLWASKIHSRTSTSIPAAALELLATACQAAIIYMEHIHSTRASAPASIYLFCSLLFEIAKSRSFFLRPGMAVLGGMTALAGGIRLALLILQEISKQPLFIDVNLRKSIGPEAISGPINRVLFLFITPIFGIGFREELGMSHLSHLDPELTSERLYKDVEPQWNVYKSNRSSAALFKACFWAWKGCAVGLVLSRLAVTGFNFSQPFIFSRVINMVAKRQEGPNDMDERSGLQGAATFLFIGIILSRTTHAHLMNRFITRLRGGLIALIIHKEHKLSQTVAKRSAAITLMTADIDGIVAGMPRCLSMPIGIVEIALGMYVLYQFIDASAFTAFAPVIFSLIASYIIAPLTAGRLAQWNKGIEARVSQTARILPQITGIKMLGLEKTVINFLQLLREKEIKISRSYRQFQAIGFGNMLIGDIVTPVVVVAAALFGPAYRGELSAAKVFPLLTVLQLIQQPLSGILGAIAGWKNTLACFARIQDFLCIEEVRDTRTRRVSKDNCPLGQKSKMGNENAHMVRFQSVDIAPCGSKRPLLRGVDFQLAVGSTTGLIGLTGGGKSTIVHGILGHSEISKGSVSVNADKIGYCGEHVWLRDTTVRANIVGDLEFDQDRFDMVVKSCLLEEDLRQLPGGADYIVGTNGSNLSGGQRQRVGIARTAYAQYSLTILDDSFSSLDHETAAGIIHHLIGPDGIFTQAGSTVLIVTHLPACLHLVDQLLILDGKSCIALKDKASIDERRESLAKSMNKMNYSLPAIKDAEEQRAIREKLEKQAVATEFNKTALRQRGSFRLYGLFIRPIGWFKMILYMIFTSMFAAGEVVPEIYIRVWIETEPHKAILFVGYAGLVFLTCIFGSLVYFFLHVKLSPYSSSHLHRQLLNTTMGATLGYLSTTTTGMLLNRYSQDMTLLSRDLPAALIRVIHCGTNAVLQIGVILSGATYLAATLPVILLALYFVQRYYLRTSRQIRHLDLEAQAPLQTYFQETATGLNHIQAFQWQDQNIRRGIMLLEESQKPFYTLLTIQQWLTMVLGLLSAALGILLVALALFIDQSSSASAIGLSFMGLIWLSIALENTMEAWTGLETSSGALARLALFEKETPQESRQVSGNLPINWPSEGRVELKNVSATYTPEDPRAAPALQDVSLSILPGQSIGIVGRSGSGKSSLFLAMLGFIPHKGKIEIDGIEIDSISLHELRSRIITISQDQVQFNASIRTNLLPSTMNDTSSAADEKVMKQNSDMEQLLSSLQIWSPLDGKGGLDAMLEDVGYSKGQMQLLSIARAILKQRETGSKLVLVDEATSNVDLETEKTADRVMEENFANCTIMTIAHRPMDLESTDGFIRLHHGALVDREQGTDSESVAEEP